MLWKRSIYPSKEEMARVFGLAAREGSNFTGFLQSPQEAQAAHSSTPDDTRFVAQREDISNSRSKVLGIENLRRDEEQRVVSLGALALRG